MKKCKADPDKCDERNDAMTTGCWKCSHEFQLFQLKCYEPVQLPEPVPYRENVNKKKKR